MMSDDDVRELLRAIRDARPERREELRQRLRAEVGQRLDVPTVPPAGDARRELPAWARLIQP